VEGRGVSRVKKRKQKKSVVISDGMKRALPPFFFFWRLSSSLNGHLPLLYPHPTPRIRLTQDGGGVDGGGGADTAVGGDAALL